MYSNATSRQPSGASALRSLHSQISNTVIDYSPWMRQQRRPTKSAGTATTATFAALPRNKILNENFQNSNLVFNSSIT